MHFCGTPIKELRSTGKENRKRRKSRSDISDRKKQSGGKTDPEYFEGSPVQKGNEQPRAEKQRSPKLFQRGPTRNPNLTDKRNALQSRARQERGLAAAGPAGTRAESPGLRAEGDTATGREGSRPRRKRALSLTAVFLIKKIPETSIESLDESEISRWSRGVNYDVEMFSFKIENLEPQVRKH